MKIREGIQDWQDQNYDRVERSAAKGPAISAPERTTPVIAVESLDKTSMRTIQERWDTELEKKNDWEMTQLSFSISPLTSFWN